MDEDANTNEINKFNENGTKANKIEDNDQPENCENKEEQLNQVIEASNDNPQEQMGE